jgi:hypothetical protein
MRKHARPFLAAIVVAGLVTPWVSSSALASCIPNRPLTQAYRFAARSQTQSTANGVTSRLSTYAPYVPTGGFSYSWVMLPGAGAFQWAQIGNYAVGGGVRRTTVQYAWTNPARQIDLPAKAVGSYHYYQVFRDTTFLTPHFWFRVDGVNVADVAFNNWSPAGAQVTGEVWIYRTQMMGATNAHQRFLENQIYYAGAWHTFAGTVINSDSTWYGMSGTAANFDIWDKACQT